MLRRESSQCLLSARCVLKKILFWGDLANTNPFSDSSGPSSIVAGGFSFSSFCILEKFYQPQSRPTFTLPSALDLCLSCFPSLASKACNVERDPPISLDCRQNSESIPIFMSTDTVWTNSKTCATCFNRGSSEISFDLFVSIVPVLHLRGGSQQLHLPTSLQNFDPSLCTLLLTYNCGFPDVLYLCFTCKHVHSLLLNSKALHCLQLTLAPCTCAVLCLNQCLDSLVYQGFPVQRQLFRPHQCLGAHFASVSRYRDNHSASCNSVPSRPVLPAPDPHKGC